MSVTSPSSNSRRSIVNRGDLLAAIASGQPGMIESVAHQLGLEYQPPRQPVPDIGSVPLPHDMTASNARPTDSTAAMEVPDLALWLVTGYQSLAAPRDTGVEDKPHYIRWHERPVDEPKYRLLAPWSMLRSRLRRDLPDRQLTSRVDIPELVRKVAERELVRDVPRLCRRRWNQRLVIVQDRSTRLIPFDHDQQAVIAEFREMLGDDQVEVLVGRHPRFLRWRASRHRAPRDEARFVGVQPLGCEHASQAKAWTPAPHHAERDGYLPPPGSHVLVLGDLGVLAHSEQAVNEWVRWGRQLKQTGCQLQALVPMSVARVPAVLRNLFSVESWQRDPAAWIRDDEQRDDQVNQILTLAAPTVRLEPGLLRDLRSLVPGGSDASLEVDVWMSVLLASNHQDGASWDDEAYDMLRPKFNSLDRDLQGKALERIRAWHAPLSPDIWFEELLCLSEHIRQLVPEQDLEDARAAVRELVRLRESGPDDDRDASNSRLLRLTSRVTAAARQDAEVGELLDSLRTRFHARQAETFAFAMDDRGVILDVKAEPGLMVTRRVSEGPREEAATSLADASGFHQRILTAHIRSTDRHIEVWPANTAAAERFWKTGKPDFVSDYGTDEYGAWFEFVVPNDAGKRIVQRMRWIKPGTFLMGSPEDEPLRFDREVQHEVTLTRGYWMADTTCTQEFWQAVMGDNPSHIKGDQKPVEQISHREACGFLSRINELLPGLEYQLPTEAQWEYACRAGTATPFSTGEQITPEQANYQSNYPYAGGTRDEYRQGAIECKNLPMNPWGLYQMHGNVREWCRDWYGAYESAAQRDPRGPKSGSSRVVRGGCWFHDARYVRSAFRCWVGANVRDHSLGFRCLSSVSAEPIEGAEVPVAEQSPQRTRIGGAEKIFRVPSRSFNGKPQATASIAPQNADACGSPLNDHDSTRANITLKPASSRVLKTDIEQLDLSRLTRPDWAIDFGRDRYGAHATFEITGPNDAQPVRQRLRWIPPGHFQMGSPEDEPGRFDNETPHDVTVTRGFWMFDTPCTQKLWLAVMDGENPSYFADPDRPVETVNWEQANQFADKLGDRIGLAFQLPTEAQWEYACRAGTQSAIYTGPLEILGDANAPDLDPIAWYGGNSGHEYDHERGDDVTSWSWLTNKQYDFKEAGTRKVAQKRPNQWGMFDMLGNVWEWCCDWYAEAYDVEDAVDPSGPSEGSARVVRGGCWIDGARYVRSAYRHWYAPGDRAQHLGFRCLSSVSLEREPANGVSAPYAVARDEPASEQRTQ